MGGAGRVAGGWAVPWQRGVAKPATTGPWGSARGDPGGEAGRAAAAVAGGGAGAFWVRRRPALGRVKLAGRGEHDAVPRRAANFLDV